MDALIWTNERNATNLATWIKSRGGVAVWKSLDLSDPGKQFLTPALEESGSPYGRPSWKVSNAPDVIVTDPNLITISVDRLVKRFRVAVRMGSQGLTLKVSDGGSRRIWREEAKAGAGAYHTFDYETQEALIWAPAESMSLTEWMSKQNKEA